VITEIVHIFVPLPGWAMLVTALCFGCGLALLLFVVLPRHRPALPDNGARV
jgi:hypothetical protein